MVTRTDLLQRACRHLSEAAPEADISAALAALPDWSLEHGKLVRCFGLKDYHQNIAFVNAIASVIHQEDHHPELILTYQRCTVKYDTHSVNAGKGGLSDNDFICAAKIDAVFQHGFS